MLRFYQNSFKYFSRHSYITALKRIWKQPQRAYGFSVLEAMIAMAILAAALLPLLAMQTQFVRSVESLERVDTRLNVRSAAINYIQAINLSKTPTGQFTLVSDDPAAPISISWRARPAAPTHPVRSEAGTTGRFKITLYEVEIVVVSPQSVPDKFSIRALGWAR